MEFSGTLTPIEMVLALVILLLLGIVIALLLARRRREQIRDHFGPEFARAVQDLGDERHAEAELVERQRRVSSYPIKPLPPDMRRHFIDTWRAVMAQFVDDPRYAVTRADDLIGEIMVARGYPMADFEQRADDLSVDHPQVISNYRKAHGIAEGQARGETTTEDLRNAMVNFKSLFEELIDDEADRRP